MSVHLRPMRSFAMPAGMAAPERQDAGDGDEDADPRLVQSGSVRALYREEGAEYAGAPGNEVDGERCDRECEECARPEHGEVEALPDAGAGRAFRGRLRCPAGVADPEQRHDDDRDLARGDEEEHGAQVSGEGDDSGDRRADERSRAGGDLPEGHGPAARCNLRVVGHESVGSGHPRPDAQAGEQLHQEERRVRGGEELADEGGDMDHRAEDDEPLPAEAVGKVAGERAGECPGRGADGGDEGYEQERFAEGVGEKRPDEPEPAGAEPPEEEHQEDRQRPGG